MEYTIERNEEQVLTIKVQNQGLDIEVSISLEIIALEEVIKVNETQFELDPSGTNREKLHRSQVELRKHLQREEEFWKQKAGMEWFKEGERNTKFFHTIVKGRRKRMRFTKQEDNEDFKLLKELPVVINDEMNEELQSMPTKEEVKRAVMGLNKKVTVNTFSYLRHISLSNFVNKIFSRIIHERLKIVLPGIISPEQTGFVQWRSIVENVLLVQEIITEIRKRGKSPNLVIKLDMMKAYERVEWLFMTKVLRRLGFGENLIDMLGDLYTITGVDFEWDDSYTKVEELTNQGEWNVEVLQDILPLQLEEYIIQHIHPLTGKEEKDTPCWMLDSGGSFTVKATWQSKHIRTPIKRSYNGMVGSRYKKTLRPFYRALPSFVIWEIYETQREENISVTNHIHFHLRHPRRKGPSDCPGMLRVLENYRPMMKVIKVLWECPPEGWLKHNTGAVSRGNLGLSSYAFCLRNHRGDIKYAEGGSMENTTNMWRKKKLS
uniref:Reverse transcriptase domain-containing protein n=1 Tax=Solanum lycopersicum TaxID=4081 RepID=A0A3Q7IXR0_SOLLC